MRAYVIFKFLSLVNLHPIDELLLKYSNIVKPIFGDALESKRRQW